MMDQSQLTTHVYTTNSGGASQAFDLPLPPEGHITVIDWANSAGTTTAVAGTIHLTIMRGDGTHILHRESKFLAANEPWSIRMDFPKGFPCYFPTAASGTAQTLSEVSHVEGSQIEVNSTGSTLTPSHVSFTVGYHFEPRSARAAGV